MTTTSLHENTDVAVANSYQELIDKKLADVLRELTSTDKDSTDTADLIERSLKKYLVDHLPTTRVIVELTDHDIELICQLLRVQDDYHYSKLSIWSNKDYYLYIMISGGTMSLHLYRYGDVWDVTGDYSPTLSNTIESIAEELLSTVFADFIKRSRRSVPTVIFEFKYVKS